MRYTVAMTCPVHGSVVYTFCLGLHQCPACNGMIVSGMSWQNRALWHIDHKIPLTAFDLLDEAQRRLAFHFTNCQPLWAADNIRKSDSTSGRRG